MDTRYFPEVGQDEATASTKVVEFPIKAPEGQTKYDIGAIQQLENYKLFMDNYVDHNCSITVHVRDDEWEEVSDHIARDKVSHGFRNKWQAHKRLHRALHEELGEESEEEMDM